MHREQRDVRIFESLMDQVGHILHQRIQIQRGADAFADVRDQGQMIRVPLQVSIQTRAFHRASDRICQRVQHQQIVRVERLDKITLHVQHAQHAVFDL